MSKSVLLPQRAVLRPSQSSPWKFEAVRTGLYYSLPSEEISGIFRNGEMHFGLFLLLLFRDKEAETWGSLRDPAQVLCSGIKK